MSTSSIKKISFLLIIALLCLAWGGYTWVQRHRPQWLHHASKPAQPAAAIGFIDRMVTAPDRPEELLVAGWALAPKGVARVELLVNGTASLPLNHGVMRTDVAQAYPQDPEAKHSGFDGKISIKPWLAHLSSLDIVVTDRDGNKTVIAHRMMASHSDKNTWADLLQKRGVRADDVFYFVMATSNLNAGGASEIDTIFQPYESKTVKVGIRIPILYLRTTQGAQADFAFDPKFPSSRKCGDRTIAEDNLQNTMDYAVAHHLPVLFTLNGGIWADAACDVPTWDINDVLEQDKNNCQWNEKNEVVADDYLRNITGSMTSPELGRSLTFNIYASKNRLYKKRNLQQAGRLIQVFAEQHPELFIGVNLDPDLYMNPFFEGAQWYDYNPGTLRQFREWLQNSGPYAGANSVGQPDLSSYRRPQALTLAEVNRLSGQKYTRWDQVEPPRHFSATFHPYWKDPWVLEWEHFRRHLVHLHYDEMSTWLTEVGINPAAIYSSQGFMAPSAIIDAFPVHLNSPAKNYDTGGMSVEGAIPKKGHLGAILYGPSAVNQIKMEGSASLFSVFRQLDPGWAVTEFNTADLRRPDRLADFAEAYEALHKIHQYGARFISPMAWNGSRGRFAGQPGFAGHTSLRESPLEDAIKYFMLSHADLPRHSLLWSFGAGGHASRDDWQPVQGTSMLQSPGLLTLSPNAQREIVLESPADLQVIPDQYSTAIIQLEQAPPNLSLQLEGQNTAGAWTALSASRLVSELNRCAAGLMLPLVPNTQTYQRLRIKLQNASPDPNTALGLRRVALYAK